MTAAATSLAAAAPGLAFSAPSPIKLVVPYAPGGATDVVARIVAMSMAEVMQRSIIVDNRSGAGGNIGSAFVASAQPDGNTMLFNGTTPLAINLAIERAAGFNPKKDLAPVGMVARLPTAIMVNASMPVKNVQEFIAYAKQTPRGLNYGTAGAGTLSQINAELFSAAVGTKMVGATYRGSSPLITDLIGGIVQVSFDNIGPYLPFIENGKLRALAVMTSKRSPRLPNVPTLAEAGIKDFDFPSNFAIWAPSGTAPAAISAFNKALNESLRKPEVIERLQALGFEPAPDAPAVVSQRVDFEHKTFADIIKRANIKLD
ncbi:MULTISPECIES: tripartite tricarboxylate transporter substrate binding protein [Comamonas]|nr:MULTISPECIES: tripartite tricarboxylate transporter substrate binding protein [Comamonas]UUC94817.1 tripartite tricarboxylate transporter substrate binding protein [Comamonas sp. C11]WEE78856.1 tripartite tricarboxylate transporter substrate binding protein [Comamonas testosteroni]